MQSIGFAAAFAAGIVSFLSPCVLPLIPGYLSFMTGVAVGDLASMKASRTVMVPALLFVAGFAVVFTALGASASVLGSLLVQYRTVLEIVAGVLVIAFGVLLLGIVKLPWLYGDARFDMGRSRSFGRGAAFVMGAAFAFGWTPCVGPVLGAILALAGTTGSAAHGAALLFVYSLGLGVPFVLTALLFGTMGPLLSRLNKHALLINRVAGTLLILVGVLIVTGQLSSITAALTRGYPGIAL
ncbi:MAG: cytochrome c biogenesis protein CcdA [Coriobacteriia bacterium]|jgi:cytochrome c-type biogenesis protein|nr:cytochrome c biogenesis protein CcdA [Coriobacteriia bacterium]